MNRFDPHSTCERARAWAALAPDAELAPFERRLLEVHLAGCSTCAHFAAEVAGATKVLRSAKLVPLRAPLRAPTWRSRRPLRVGHVAATAAIALMAVGVATWDPLTVNDRAGRTFTVTVISQDSQTELSELRQARRQDLVASGSLSAPPVWHFGPQPI